MKKLWLYSILVVIGFFTMYSCGSSTDRTEETTTTNDQIETRAEQSLTLHVNGEAIEFDNVEMSYDERFGNQLTVLGFFADASTEEIGEITMTSSSFELNIEDISTGKQDQTNISLKEYRVTDAQSEIHTLEIGSGMFGAVIEEVIVDFSAMAHDEEGNSFELTGQYVK